jgi:hypothetical protein
VVCNFTLPRSKVKCKPKDPPMKNVNYTPQLKDQLAQIVKATALLAEEAPDKCGRSFWQR